MLFHVYSILLSDHHDQRIESQGILIFCLFCHLHDHADPQILHPCFCVFQRIVAFSLRADTQDTAVFGAQDSHIHRALIMHGFFCDNHHQLFQSQTDRHRLLLAKGVKMTKILDLFAGLTDGLCIACHRKIDTFSF